MSKPIISIGAAFVDVFFHTSHEMEKYIHLALTPAKEKKVSGKEVTPFLLQYIARHTGGESLEVNITLTKHNAKVGAAISVAYTNH